LFDQALFDYHLEDNEQLLSVLDEKAQNFEQVFLEIGFGHGEHIHWQAQNMPQTLWLGCELFENGIAHLLSLIHKSALHDNLLIYTEHARKLLKQLPENYLDGAYLLFADPWPKKRHAERRFISQENLALFYHVLKSGAELRIASDDCVLIAWIDEQLEIFNRFEVKLRCWRDQEIKIPMTKYEKKALREGRIPKFWVVKKA